MMIWSALLLSVAAATAPLHTEGRFFKDSKGRVVILRGINVSGDAKVPPFTPIDDALYLDPLPALGFNAMRLLFTWEAFEPTRGHDNTAYLDYITNIVRWGHARGLVTIIDFHQDALSRFLAKGCGDGFPAWAIPEGTARQTPDNSANCAKWFAIQWLDGDVRRTWQALYHDEDGLRQAYIDMARRVALHLANEPGVVGYDLLNEPAGHEANEIMPLYDDMAAMLAEAHPGALIFVEPDARAVLGIQSSMPQPDFPGAVYAPHYYDGFTRVINHYPGYSMGFAFKNMRKKAYDWNIPLFLGEFGIPPTVGNALGYMRAQYDRLDDAFASSAQWTYNRFWNDTDKDGWNTEDFSITDGDGVLRGNYRPRPYAQAIAGAPIRMQVNDVDDIAERWAELTWEHVPSAGSTQMFVPPNNAFFAQPLKIDTEGDDLHCAVQGRTLTCEAKSGGTKRVRLSSP